MALKGVNVRLEIQKTLGTAVTATGISNANPAVVSHSGTDPSNGDYVVITATGIAELDGQVARVANVSAGVSFELEGINSTNYGTFSTGSFQPISAWETVAKATSINLGDASPTELDASTLLDKNQQIEYGIPGAASGTVGTLYDPVDAGVVEVLEATENNEARVLRVTWPGGQKAVFNANISGGEGFDMSQNALVTSGFSVSQKKRIKYYAS